MRLVATLLVVLAGNYLACGLPVYCPVCNMTASDEFRVSFRYNQDVFACSQDHAQALYDSAESYMNGTTKDAARVGTALTHPICPVCEMEADLAVCASLDALAACFPSKKNPPLLHLS